jgi:hypothetical protein
MDLTSWKYLLMDFADKPPSTIILINCLAVGFSTSLSGSEPMFGSSHVLIALSRVLTVLAVTGLRVRVKLSSTPAYCTRPEAGNKTQQQKKAPPYTSGGAFHF